MDPPQIERFSHSGALRCYVFPFCIVRRISTEEWAFKRFLGTGFLIGNRGFALTAAHIIREFVENSTVALFALHDGSWRAFEVEACSSHRDEDVGIVKLSGGPWRSIFRLSNSWAGASVNYRMFGYPDDVASELTNRGKVEYRPDLIYAQGYIRRRVSFTPLSLSGTQFFELSEVVGQGCSGSPIFNFKRPALEVIGIYVAERINDRGTNRAYAVREEAFRNWHPSIMDRTVLEESQYVTLDVQS